MRRMLLAFMTVLAVLAGPVSAQSADLTTEQMQSLREINTKIETVHDLKNRGVITQQQETAGEAVYVKDASKVVGHDVTAAEIQKLVTNADKTEGLGTFLNIVVVLGGILVLFGAIGTVGWLLQDVLEAIPEGVWHVLADIFAGVTCSLGYLVGPFTLGIARIEPLWFVIPGALGVAGCLFFTQQLYFSDSSKTRAARSSVYMGPGLINFNVLMFGICTAVWATMAIFYNHMFPASGVPHVLAFASMIALQACLGFSAISMPGCIAMGWKDERQVPQSVFSSLIILAVYIFLKINGSMTGDLVLFERGAIFMGAFVYFLGLLIMSSKWYLWWDSNKDESWARYIALQAITIASGILAMYLGSVYGMGALLGIGGTFFAIYALEKWYEIPWGGIGWPLSLLAVGLAGWWFVGFANTHAEYFIWGIK